MSSTASSSKPSFATSKGDFEACFGKGLDLSEFSTAGEKPAKSAAQELLRVKSLEREQREQEEAKEQVLESAIKERVSSLLKAKQRKDSGNIVVNALVKMHSHDTNEPLYRSKKMGKRRNNSKSAAVKKSRRSKHSR